MTEDLLQDLVLYKKSHEKAVSTAARSLITLFREVYTFLTILQSRNDSGTLMNTENLFSYRFALHYWLRKTAGGLPIPKQGQKHLEK